MSFNGTISDSMYSRFSGLKKSHDSILKHSKPCKASILNLKLYIEGMKLEKSC